MSADDLRGRPKRFQISPKTKHEQLIGITGVHNEERKRLIIANAIVANAQELTPNISIPSAVALIKDPSGAGGPHEGFKILQNVYCFPLSIVAIKMKLDLDSPEMVISSGVLLHHAFRIEANRLKHTTNQIREGQRRFTSDEARAAVLEDEQARLDILSEAAKELRSATQLYEQQHHPGHSFKIDILRLMVQPGFYKLPVTHRHKLYTLLEREQFKEAYAYLESRLNR